MSKRAFRLTFEATATIELDDAVIDAVDAKWRKSLYDLRTPEEIAKHIGFNLIINGIRLSAMDGWADQPNRNARVVNRPDWEIEVKEQYAW